jgi:hypothetical protein
MARCKTHARINDMSWPLPLCELEWKLRYSSYPEKSELLQAASIISAYRQMIWDSEKTRRHVIRGLRRAMNAEPAREGGE